MSKQEMVSLKLTRIGEVKFDRFFANYAKPGTGRHMVWAKMLWVMVDRVKAGHPLVFILEKQATSTGEHEAFVLEAKDLKIMYEEQEGDSGCKHIAGNAWMMNPEEGPSWIARFYSADQHPPSADVLISFKFCPCCGAKIEGAGPNALAVESAVWSDGEGPKNAVH